MVISLEQGAELHMAQLMPLPLTVSCFSKIQIGFTFLVPPPPPGNPGQRAVKRMMMKRVTCICNMQYVSNFMDCVMYLQLSEVTLRDSNPSHADIQGNVPNVNNFIRELQVITVFVFGFLTKKNKKQISK